MSNPAQVVAESFSQARQYANQHSSQLVSFTNALSAALTEAPTITVDFQEVQQPTDVQVPDAPDFGTDSLAWDASISAAKPTALDVNAPNITIDDFTAAAPVLSMPAEPALDFGTLPVLDYGAKPVVPAVADVSVPDAPLIELPAAPSYLALNTPTFAGVDTRDDYLTRLEDIPTLDLVAPTPYSYALGAKYASDLLSAVKAKLTERIAGGTGLDPAVEQAIWDRARSREEQVGLANEAEVTRTHEAYGFPVPSGALAAALRTAQQDTFSKLSTLSRDVAIKQAELEQENVKDAINVGMQLESKLIDYAFQLEQLSFQTAKEVADNAVAIYNAQVDKYKALISTYQLYAQAYETIIKGQLAKVEVFKAEIAAEQAKADTNRTLVEQYKASIDATLSQVKIYEVQIAGARARMDLEGARIAAAGEEIKAYVAGINGETAKLEAYKVGVQAQATRVEAYKAGVEGQTARVQAFEAQARAFAAKVGAQGERARAELAWYTARVQAKTSEWDGYRARVQGEAERFRALSSKSGALAEGYRAEVAAAVAKIEQNAKMFEAKIAHYSAQQNYTLNAAKINSEVISANSARILDAAKVGAQVYAQLTASAYSMINATAGVNASSQMGVSYNYSNDTSATVPPVTTI